MFQNLIIFKGHVKVWPSFEWVSELLPHEWVSENADPKLNSVQDQVLWLWPALLISLFQCELKSKMATGIVAFSQMTTLDKVKNMKNCKNSIVTYVSRAAKTLDIFFIFELQSARWYTQWPHLPRHSFQVSMQYTLCTIYICVQVSKKGHWVWTKSEIVIQGNPI